MANRPQRLLNFWQLTVFYLCKVVMPKTQNVFSAERSFCVSQIVKTLVKAPSQNTVFQTKSAILGFPLCPLKPLKMSAETFIFSQTQISRMGNLVSELTTACSKPVWKSGFWLYGFGSARICNVWWFCMVTKKWHFQKINSVNENALPVRLPKTKSVCYFPTMPFNNKNMFVPHHPNILFIWPFLWKFPSPCFVLIFSPFVSSNIFKGKTNTKLNIFPETLFLHPNNLQDSILHPYTLFLGVVLPHLLREILRVTFSRFLVVNVSHFQSTLVIISQL